MEQKKYISLTEKEQILLLKAISKALCKKEDEARFDLAVETYHEILEACKEEDDHYWFSMSKAQIDMFLNFMRTEMKFCNRHGFDTFVRTANELLVAAQKFEKEEI